MAVGLVEARGLAQGSEALGSANSPRAKARGSEALGSVTDVKPDAAQDAAQAQARAGGRGSSTGRSAEDGTPADGAQPAA